MEKIKYNSALKCTNPTSLKDYRPISILPLLSKILEKIVNEQVTNYLTLTKQTDTLQSGFKANHSTTTAVLKITEDIRKALDDGKVTVMTLLDFSKAFDTVNHDILIEKLKNLNMHKNTIQWIKTYLYGRQQRVIFNSEKSSWVPTMHGVPQGSVLGPMLFAIYISDAPKLLKNTNYHLYADDLQLYTHSTLFNVESAVENINKDLQLIYEWSVNNLLLFNSLKTQPMIIGSKHLNIEKIQKECPQIQIGNNLIPFVSSAKNLGITFDNKMCWNEHVKTVCKKSYSVLYKLFKLGKFIPQKLKLHLIKTLVYPILDYCDICMCDISSELNKKLQRVQNSCIRYVTGLRKYDHISSEYTKLRELNIHQRRDLHALSLLYKTVNLDVVPSYITSLTLKLCDSGSRTTRSTNNNLLSIPLHRTARYSNSYTVKYSRMWNNNISSAIRGSPSLAIFKSRIHRNFLSE